MIFSPLRKKHQMIRRAVGFDGVYTKPSWTHEKCRTLLHVFKAGSSVGDRCYCRRKKLSTDRHCEFIESAYQNRA